MSIFQNHVGISISSSKINLVEVTYSDNNYIVNNIDEEYFDEFLDFDFKETRFINILQQAFDNLLLRNPLNSNFISFALPTNQFYFFELPVEPALHKADLDKHIQWEFSINYPTLKYDDFVLRSFNLDVSTQNKSIMIVGLRKKIINTLNLFALRNKLKLKFIDNEHIASAISVGYGTNTEDVNLLSILISEDCFSVLLMKEQSPIYFAKKSFSKITDFSRLIDQVIIKLISVYGEKYAIDKVVLFGDKNNSEIKNFIESKTNSVLLEFNPFEFLNINEKQKDKDLLKNKPQRFAAAVGMSARLI